MRQGGGGAAGAGPRPVFLDLRRIRLPVTARVSILHRLSGLLLFLALAPALHYLGLALSGPAGYARAAAALGSGLGGLVLLLLLWAYSHHLLAGLRLLALDLGLGHGREASARSARLVLAAAPVLALLLWGLLWL
ncbi:MAG: succinate dehydrogenase, cytochrome b556 subunit [Gammaproteobacteria bacterium]|nr:MAG: succinate dehydrogenase, cytochrome b556 subunit [Gammaproteobacteria bacterium]